MSRASPPSRAHAAQKRQVVVGCSRRPPPTFRIGDLIDACPGILRPTVNRALADLQRVGEIACLGRGRHAVWQKRYDQPPQAG